MAQNFSSINYSNRMPALNNINNSANINPASGGSRRYKGDLRDLHDCTENASQDSNSPNGRQFNKILTDQERYLSRLRQSIER
jgi:hypothetical protein